MNYHQTSIQEDKMLFSIIIPTYNPKQFLPRLLNSIETNECQKDIEVIIADDCSTESFDDILEIFSNLNIKVITNNKHTGFPRDGKQNGLDTAQGDWVCFIDQDDYFEDYAFDRIKDAIDELQAKYCIMSMIFDHRAANVILHNYNSGLTHGKLFERKFLKQYNIKYANVTYSEDICFTCKVAHVIIANALEYTILNEPFYHWIKHEDSLSHINNYLLFGILDQIIFLTELSYEYLFQYKNNKNKCSAFISYFLSNYFRTFFYEQSKIIFQNELYEIEKKKWEDVLNKYLLKFKASFNFSNQDIINYIKTNLITSYNNIRNEQWKSMPFIETMTFEQWFNLIFKEEQ